MVNPSILILSEKFSRRPTQVETPLPCDQTPPHSPAQPSDPSNQTIEKFTIKVAVVVGNIIERTVDVIVNIKNNSVYLNGEDHGVISRAILKLDISNYRQYMQHLNRLPYVSYPGDAFWTPSFGLQFKGLIHVLGRSSGNPIHLKSAYYCSFCLANDYGCRSLAIPLIFTGSSSDAVEESSVGLSHALDDYQSHFQGHERGQLERIEVFVLDAQTQGEVMSHLVKKTGEWILVTDVA